MTPWLASENIFPTEPRSRERGIVCAGDPGTGQALTITADEKSDENKVTQEGFCHHRNHGPA